MATANLTAQRLRELLHYDPETGLFTRLVRTSIRINVGDQAGYLSDGYRIISIDYKRFTAGRLAWLYMTGEWPTLFVDHINGVRDDNRWRNLREVDNAMNMQNMPRARKDSSTGITGVSFDRERRKFYAYININGRMKSLGRFEQVEDAARVAAEARRVHHPGFTR